MQGIQPLDERRDIVVPGNTDETLKFCVEHFILQANHAIATHGKFTVALSGGSTPAAIYKSLSDPKNSSRIDWTRVFLFWSDERWVPQTDKDSNYHMAMTAGLNTLNIPSNHIFPMPTNGDDYEAKANAYEKLIQTHVPNLSFDLVMLGMGEDGHTASLFPKTHGLHSNRHSVIANFIPQKDTWRLTLTFECINSARHIAIYVLGANKAPMVKRVLTSPFTPDELPIQNIGTPSHKALWILDDSARGSAP